MCEAGAVKRPAERPILITDAERSQDDQLRSRQIRYVSMMGLRAVCLVLAAVLVTMKIPLTGLWVSLCLVGMVLLPWLAVLTANDRPPKERHRLRRHRPGPPPIPRPPPIPQARIIDADQ